MNATIAPSSSLLPDGAVRVHFGDTHADFHPLWLRHYCDSSRHPKTGERTLSASEVDPALRVRETWVQDGALHVLFEESGKIHRSVFQLTWLRNHAYALGREAVPPPPSELAPYTLDAALHADRAGVVAEARARTLRDGAVLVRGEDVDTEALIDAFAATGWRIVPTHFGRIEDLRTDNSTNANTDQLGYTDAPVELHTDQPFLAEPPRWQMLHCMTPAPEGGDNFVVDARAAARYLRSLDAEAFRLLSTVPIHFHRQQRAFEALQVRPMLALDASGELTQIRASYFTEDPPRVAFAEMDAWYRAYIRFERLVRDPAHQLRFKLRRGDWLLYDNHRMLHARTRFEGARWLRGIYFNPAE